MEVLFRSMLTAAPTDFRQATQLSKSARNTMGAGVALATLAGSMSTTLQKTSFEVDERIPDSWMPYGAKMPPEVPRSLSRKMHQEELQCRLRTIFARGYFTRFRRKMEC
jgi:hypothetical protein